MNGGDESTVVHRIKSYTGGRLDEEFFKKFKDAVKEFANIAPSGSVRKITVVLPDNAVLTDAVSVPTMKGIGQTKKMLDLKLGGIYCNYKDLRVITNIAKQNKQYSAFSVTAVQKQIVSSVYAACSENKMLVDTLTYASCAAISGAVMINPKLKNESYLFLDIQDVYSRFVFVANGNPIGFYRLPRGFEFLRKNRILETVPSKNKEDMFYENFRFFVKWALLLIRENEKLTDLGKPKFVCVNLPKDLVGLIDAVNRESEENGIIFTCLTNADDKRELPINPELYGSLFPKKLVSAGKF